MPPKAVNVWKDPEAPATCAHVMRLLQQNPGVDESREEKQSMFEFLLGPESSKKHSKFLLRPGQLHQKQL